MPIQSPPQTPGHTATASHPAAATHRAPGPRWPYELAFWILLAAFELFVLSLPLFPTGDSGLHIYYATIFRDLITHSSPFYAQFYTVRHIIQPYLLHYYVFIGLCHFVSADTAEKLIVCIVLAVFALGFRSLVRGLSLASPALPLLAFPFLLNWPLSMGALNYTFALGLLMFALGAYERFSLPGPVSPRLWRFAGLLILLVLSHPVPLLLLVCIMAVDLILRWWQRHAEPGFWPHQQPRLLAFGLTCIAFVIPVLLADKGEMGKSAAGIRFHPDYIRQILNASRLAMVYGEGHWGQLYNRAYFLLFPLSLALVLWSGFFRRLRARHFTGFDRLALFTVLFLLASLFAPFELNGSGFFSLRLWFPCWVLGVAASAGALRGRGPNLAVALFAVALSGTTLWLAQSHLAPIARYSEALERAPVPTGKKGLFIQSRWGEVGSASSTNYPVYWWDGGRTFSAHNDLMLNSAWLYLTIIPLKENGQAGLLRDYTPRVATENPNEIAFYLTHHPAQQARALHDADFILFVDPPGAHSDVSRLIRLSLEPHIADWHCDLHGFYAICTKTSASAAS